MILAANAALSLLATSVQLYTTFDRDRSEIIDTFNLIETSFRSSLVDAIWTFNFQQVETLLDGIYTKTGVATVNLTVESGQSWELGQNLDEDGLIQMDFALEKERFGRKPAKIADLRVGLSLNSVWDRLWDQALVVFFSNLAKTMIASLVMLAIFASFVSRHLRRISEYVSTSDWKHEADTLVLDRAAHRDHDDLDEIVDAINSARADVLKGIQTLEHEVSARRYAQAELAEQNTVLESLNTELVRSNRELDDFAHIASHDLKEPLRAIFNHANFLLEDYDDKLEGDGQKRLMRLIALSERMQGLISSLLSYSRLGQSETSSVAVDVNTIVEEIRVEFQDELESTNSTISCPSPLPTLVVNPVHLATVLRNLVANGLKYNQSDGKLVELGFHDEVTCADNTVKNVFYVRDNGIGIEDRFRDDIFRLFKRLHSDSKFGPGTGAGLSFVKRIVENSQGEIWFESIVGEGTTFYFTLPTDETGIQKPASLSDAENSTEAA